MAMVSPTRGHAGVLRNGGWILLFYRALAATLVPASILLSKQRAFGLEASLPGTLVIFMALITVAFWTRIPVVPQASISQEKHA